MGKDKYRTSSRDRDRSPRRSRYGDSGYEKDRRKYQSHSKGEDSGDERKHRHGRKDEYSEDEDEKKRKKREKEEKKRRDREKEGRYEDDRERSDYSSSKHDRRGESPPRERGFGGGGYGEQRPAEYGAGGYHGLPPQKVWQAPASPGYGGSGGYPPPPGEAYQPPPAQYAPPGRYTPPPPAQYGGGGYHIPPQQPPPIGYGAHAYGHTQASPPPPAGYQAYVPPPQHHTSPPPPHSDWGHQQAGYQAPPVVAAPPPATYGTGPVGGYVARPEYGSTGGGAYHPQHHSTAQGQTGPVEKINFETPAAPAKPLKQSGGALESFTTGLNSALHDYARSLFPASSEYTQMTSGAPGTAADAGPVTGHRFDSFAPNRSGNGVKWYVDGKDYMYAVSVALENARKYIYIMDWWLSPEVYLRRPPKLNEQYRLDRMLQAAASKGVKINVIVYKEVTQALTLDSAHTKHHLEDLHPNILVFRHPDHLPDRDNVIRDTFNKLKSGNYRFGDGLKGIYGMKDDITLYFAHHEKLCLIDGEIAFMGGLDLCFGRFDTNDHPIADAHPNDLNAIIFPGQDYNNARFMDFQHVDKYEENQVSRLELSRMGWTDVEMALIGPTVQDLERHFVERWNYIYHDKYDARGLPRYKPLDESWFEGGHGYHRRHVKEKVKHAKGRLKGQVLYGEDEYGRSYDEETEPEGVRLQICRSASKWSHGTPGTEHSIANAYIEIISAAKHFVYIENQFFITATDPKQKPILNMIGRAMVDRIIRAARSGEKFRIVVIIPAVPGFAGDLQSDDALGTRAIMEFQYRSIHNDRGFSIMEQIAKAGIDPKEYIRFYNLRNYDRINNVGVEQGQAVSGVSYEAAARVHDQQVGGGYYGGARGDEYDRYQKSAPRGGTWDSVSKCYMLDGYDIRNVPWEGDPDKEIDAFVSEELYVHSKLLIADDKIVIMGSANLNDRSQLGDHDSEIACIIEDPTPLPSQMNGRPYTASHFAATLRRQIFRKHLGLIPAQNFHTVDENMLPIPEPNIYDFDSAEDRLVTDPLGDQFWNFWNRTAQINTGAFARVFHTVPHSDITNWKKYEEYWTKHFVAPKGADGKPSGEPPVKWGHVVKSDFSPGAAGAREVNEILASVRGSLVEMPLDFLREEDVAKEGLGLNALTETLYT